MEDKEYAVDIADMASLLKENRKPILRITGCFLAVALLYVILAFFLFPKYESESMLRIKQERGSSSLMAAMAGFTGGFLSTDSLQMESYVEIAKSRSVIVPIIEETEKLNFFGEYPKYEKYLEKNIKIDPVQMTDILKIKVTAKTGEKAQKVNQMLIQGFLKKIADLNSSEKSALKNFLEDRLKTAKDDLEKSEAALQDYKIKHKIISPDKNAEVFAERIAEAEKQLAANRVELEMAKTRVATINSQLYGSGASNADNQVLQQYNKQLAELETTRIAYKEKYTEKHPRMIDLEERIAQLKARVKEEQAKIASLQAPSDNAVHQGLVAKKYSSEGALAVLSQKADALQREVDENNAELEKLPEVQRGYVRLARDYSVANEIYAMLTKKLEETKITEFQEPNNVQVIDEPTLPEDPASPRILLTLVLAVLLGLMCSNGYVVAHELLNKTVRTAADVKQLTKLPVLGMIPDETILLQKEAAGKEDKKSGRIAKFKEFIWKK